MEAKELRQKSTGELQKLLQELREKLFEYRLQLAQNQMKKSHLVGEIRADIARVMMVLNEIPLAVTASGAKQSPVKAGDAKHQLKQ